jgi:hypothetical protein
MKQNLKIKIFLTQALLIHVHEFTEEALMMRYHLIDLLNLAEEKLREMPAEVNPHLLLFGV